MVEKMFALTDTMGPYEPSTMIDLIKRVCAWLFVGRVFMD